MSLIAMENTSNADNHSFPKLSEIPAGRAATVVMVDNQNAAAIRLMEMGFGPGIVIRVIKSAPFGDPIEVRLRGYNLALRRSEADAVTVEVGQ